LEEALDLSFDRLLMMMMMMTLDKIYLIERVRECRLLGTKGTEITTETSS